MDALNEILPIAKEEFLPAVIRFKWRAGGWSKSVPSGCRRGMS